MRAKHRSYLVRSGDEVVRSTVERYGRNAILNSTRDVIRDNTLSPWLQLVEARRVIQLQNEHLIVIP